MSFRKSHLTHAGKSINGASRDGQVPAHFIAQKWDLESIQTSNSTKICEISAFSVNQ